ncbi:MAG: glycoside hydrolase family 16 protein [Reichenbachiella sp.]
MKFYRLLIILIAIVFNSACKSDGDEEDTSIPSNLAVEYTVSEDGSGVIKIVASADHASLYEFYMDEEEGAFESNIEGLLSYTYTTAGIYDIEVRAYGSSGRYISKTNEVNVIVGDIGGPVDVEDGYNTPLTYEGMNLVWQDEFSGSQLDTDSWTYEIGTGNSGWGNNELQYYTDDNTTVSDGVLTIEAREESFQGSNYTSSRIVTDGKESFRYGRIDMRAVLPQGQGIWPALWMLGSNFRAVSWPACGEIDIMEMVGGSENTTHGTVHWDNNGNANYGGKYQLDEGIFSDEYHVFTIIWNSSAITWYVDDVQFHVIDTTPASLSEFHNEFFFIFNVAVGGNWPGSPDANTRFPQQMKVDFVRVFQDK